MPAVKDISRVSQKWSQNTQNATGNYTEGVQNPKTDWATATQAAQENYKQAVTKAANEGRFSRGVAKAGTAKQQNNALAKGASRFGQGVAVAQPDYADAMAPVLRTIQNTVLPPRKPKGDPSNIQRVSAIATALHAAKVGPSGGTR
jgi:hypothetical protein